MKILVSWATSETETLPASSEEARAECEFSSPIEAVKYLLGQCSPREINDLRTDGIGRILRSMRSETDQKS